MINIAMGTSVYHFLLEVFSALFSKFACNLCMNERLRNYIKEDAACKSVAEIETAALRCPELKSLL